MEQILEFLSSLHSSEGLKHLVATGGVLAVTAIIFIETGLLVGFFLPGDSLLITAGIFAASDGTGGPGILNVFWLTTFGTLAAIIGDQCGYLLGRKGGRLLYQKEDSLLFKKKHLVAAHDFYERHGARALIFARFVPIFRTFVPFAAGMANMNYAKFFRFNVVGGLIWVPSMVFLGYGLGLTPLANHLHKIIVVVVFVSVLPILISVGKNFLRSRRPPNITPLVLAFLALTGTADVTAAALRADFRFSQIHSFLRFVQKLDEGDSGRPNPTYELFAKSPQNSAETQAHLKAVSDLLWKHREHVPFLLTQAAFSKNLSELSDRSLGLFDASDLVGLQTHLKALLPIYDQLVWRPYQKRLERYTEKFERVAIAKNLAGSIESSLTFFKTPWPPEQAMIIFLYPLADEDVKPEVENLGPIVSLGIPLESKNFSFNDAFSLVHFSILKRFPWVSSPDQRVEWRDYFLKQSSLPTLPTSASFATQALSAILSGLSARWIATLSNENERILQSVIDEDADAVRALQGHNGTFDRAVAVRLTASFDSILSSTWREPTKTYSLVAVWATDEELARTASNFFARRLSSEILSATSHLRLNDDTLPRLASIVFAVKRSDVPELKTFFASLPRKSLASEKKLIGCLNDRNRPYCATSYPLNGQYWTFLVGENAQELSTKLTKLAAEKQVKFL